MASKKVSDLIIDKFLEDIEKDNLFKNISDELKNLFIEGKYDKDKIESILKKKRE